MTQTLTLQSSPAGIEMSVKNNTTGFVEWLVTNTTRDYADGTQVEILAPNTVGETQTTPEWPLRFIQWKDNGTVIGTNRMITVTMSAPVTRKAYYEEQVYFPTRRPTRRSDKFEGKVDKEVYGLRTTALKPMMVEQQEVTTAQQAALETKVGTYLHSEGLYGLQIHHYRNYSQELYGLTRLFAAATLNKEASLKAEKWKVRLMADGQAQADVERRLKAIAQLFGITVTFA